MIPLIFESLIFLSVGVSSVFLSLLLILGIIEMKTGYTGRIGIFISSLLLWQIFYYNFSSLSWNLQFYLNFGTVLGICAMASYFFKLEYKGSVYNSILVTYCAISIIILSFYFSVI